jgi:large subunit ribosomal protein L4
MRRAALLSALASKVADGQIKVIDAFAVDAVKTKPVADALARLGAARRTLLLEASPTRELLLSVRNLPDITVRRVPGVTAYDLMLAETVLISQAALDRLVEVYGDA